MKKSRMAAFAAGAGVGMATEYMLDPQRGRRRRRRLAKRLSPELRRAAKETAQKARAPLVRRLRDPSRLNDPALEAKVETELFRPEDAPKGSVVVNVEKRRVVLRGQVESRERIDELVRRASEVEGVAAVESLLHLPGEPAPMKA